MKDTKILIPEIPGEWTQRSRNGHKNIWNSKENERFYRKPTNLPEITLEPPSKGLYAERIDGAWYWVNGCEKCSGNHDKHSYIICDDHNRCETCGIHRSEITDTPWGTRGGWICAPCEKARSAKRKAEALQAAKESGHQETDCYYEDTIICPYCATKRDSDDIHESVDGVECEVCEGVFNLEVEYTASYTTKGVTPPTPAAALPKRTTGERA